MRERIVRVALAAVVLAVVLFGVPLAVAVERTIRSDERSELERSALRAAAAVSPAYRTHDPVELPPSGSEIRVGLYDTSGRLVAGAGPSSARDLLRVTPRRVTQIDTSSDMVVNVPVTSGETVIATVRASSPLSVVRAHVWQAWGIMAAIALVAALCAVTLAAIAARRLTRPLIQLENAATDVGEGNFGVRARLSGVPEIDRAGRALNKTAERIGDLVARERAFSAHASHQLRTPLTRLRLELESALDGNRAALPGATAEAIVSIDHLSRTVDDVLSLARGSAVGGGFDARDLIDDLRDRWHGTLARQDRPLRIAVEDPPRSTASMAAARQIVDVLVDNALKHGQGAVTVRAREMAGALAIDVIDDGRATSVRLPEAGPTVDSTRAGAGGIGLGLACSLARAEGGRVVLANGEPKTRFTVLLPAQPDSM